MLATAQLRTMKGEILQTRRQRLVPGERGGDVARAEVGAVVVPHHRARERVAADRRAVGAAHADTVAAGGGA